ncbi:MAG: ComEC/Rec2 family competence protein, partial [Oscillospiraceae bacterium]
MKRPLAKAGLCLLFSLLVFSFCSVFIILAGGVLAGSLILLRGHLKSTLQRKYLLLACISVLVGGALSASALAVEHSLTEAYCGKSVTAKMTAISKRKTVDGYAVCVSVEEIDGRSIRKFKAEIYPEDTVEEGDCFLAKTTFGEKNKMKRINGEPVLTARETVIESFFLREQNIYAVLKKCRDALSGSIFAFLSGEEGGLVCSVMTGDKDFLKYETKDNFARSGISHILAVSGLHITVIIGALWKLIKRFRPRWLAFLLLLAVCCALTLFYSGALTVMRSAVMCLFAFGAQLAMRKSDAATSLAAAVIFLSLLSPRCVLDVSFWLSFSSCFALTVAYPWYEKRRESESLKKQNFILQQAQKILMPAVFISALSLPVLLFAGMPLSVIAPLTNLFVIPLVPWLIIPGFMTAICYALPFLFEIAKLTALISGLAAKIILLISELFASFSLSAVCANAPYLKIWIIFAILLVTLYLLFARDKLPRGLVAYCVCFMLLFGIG